VHRHQTLPFTPISWRGKLLPIIYLPNNLPPEVLLYLRGVYNDTTELNSTELTQLNSVQPISARSKSVVFLFMTS